MKFKDIKNKKLVLSNFGTITTGGVEYSIADFENMIKDGEYFLEPIEFSFDSEKKAFTIKITILKNDYGYYGFDEEEDYDGVIIYSMELTNQQKELLEQGKVDANLQRLIALAEKSQYEKKQREIHEKAIETGEYPTSREDIKIYKDYLQEQLKKTNSKLISNRIVAFSPVVSAGLCALLLRAMGIGFDNNQELLPLLSWVGAIVSGMYTLGVGGSVFFGDESLLYVNGKLKNEIKLLKQKIEDLEGMDKDKALFDVSIELSSEGLEHEDAENATQYNNIFLQEIDEVKKSIVKLPENEREKYVRPLATLLAKYIKEVEEIIDKDGTKFEFGKASHIWELNTQMLPEVFRLGALVNERLATVREKTEVLKGCQKVKESIDAISTSRVDGWTDGLSSDGAYAVRKSY